MSFQEVLLKKNLVIIFNKSDLDNFEKKKNQMEKRISLYRKKFQKYLYLVKINQKTSIC